MKRRGFLAAILGALGFGIAPKAESSIRSEFAKIDAGFNKFPALTPAKGHYECPKCGGKAFLFRRIPEMGDMAVTRDVMHLDGSPIKPCTAPVCDSCGANIGLGRPYIREYGNG